MKNKYGAFLSKFFLLLIIVIAHLPPHKFALNLLIETLNLQMSSLQIKKLLKLETSDSADYSKTTKSHVLT